MKKFIGIGLVFLLTIGVFVGCGDSVNVDRNTVYIQKKGNIISTDIEKLDKEYYDAEELESEIKTYIEEFQNDHGDSVSLKSFSVDDNVAKLVMKYNSYTDYQDFNEIELYQGTVVRAQADGYDFETDFSMVLDGEKEKTTRQKILEEDDNKVVIIKANVDVKVDGTILYVSNLNTELKGKNTVSITDEENSEEAEYTYIIYQ